MRLRFLAASLAIAFVTSIGPSAVFADQVATEPEQHALDLINQARAAQGAAALQWDSRLADIAQWRSDYQVANGFGHLSSWDPILSSMNAMGIVYDAYGEVLVLGTPRTPMESAVEAVATWRASQPHWDWLSSPAFNYIALGVARDANGWYYWTGLLMHVAATAPTPPPPPSPLPSPPPPPSPAAYMTGSQLGDAIEGKRRVIVSWSGDEASLFRLQKRVGSGRWRAASDWTGSMTRALDLRVGRTYYFRVRARDAAGNRGAWSTVLQVAL